MWWYLVLQSCQFTVCFRKGCFHSNANFFSWQTVNTYLDEWADPHNGRTVFSHSWRKLVGQTRGIWAEGWLMRSCSSLKDLETYRSCTAKDILPTNEGAIREKGCGLLMRDCYKMKDQGTGIVVVKTVVWAIKKSLVICTPSVGCLFEVLSRERTFWSCGKKSFSRFFGKNATFGKNWYISNI